MFLFCLLKTLFRSQKLSVISKLNKSGCFRNKFPTVNKKLKQILKKDHRRGFCFHFTGILSVSIEKNDFCPLEMTKFAGVLKGLLTLLWADRKRILTKQQKDHLRNFMVLWK